MAAVHAQKSIMPRLRRAVWMLLACALVLFAPGAALAAESPAGQAQPPTITLTLNDCILLALDNNPGLQEKLAVLNKVEGDVMVDRSRFFSHWDVLASFERKDGTLNKTYYPGFNPAPVSSFGAASIGTVSSGGSGGLDIGGLSTEDIESLTGVSTSEIASLASQFGVDLSQFGMRPLPQATPAQRVAAQRAMERAAQAPIVIDTPLGPITISDEQQAQIQELIRNSVLNTSSESAAGRNYSENTMSIRYSRRLMEWGKDPVSEVGIRANRRLAIFNYEQEMRNVLSDLRRTFYTSLLKEKQISERFALLEAYEKKHRDLQLRYEVAQDVPMIDVLTAELDVLNERLRINTLENDLVALKLDLLKLLGQPLGANIKLNGEPPDLKQFAFSMNDIVKLTMDNSYQISYLKQELTEEERELRDISRSYKPVYSGKAGFEDKRTSLGFSINNSDNTYGLDMGIEQWGNLPSSSSASSLFSTGSNSNDNNKYLGVSVSWVLDDNMKRKGITKKQLEEINEMKAQLQAQAQAEELSVRNAYQDLLEAVQQLEIQEDRMNISRRRLDITRKLREFGKVQEFQLDSYRSQFFSDQDRYFEAQETVIKAQETLRKIMGVFE